MSKHNRQEMIRWLIQQYTIKTQHELVQLLHQHDIEVTQSTLSRDLSDLHVKKGKNEQGDTCYFIPDDNDTASTFQQLCILMQENVMSVEAIAFTVVITTALEMANIIADILDGGIFEEVAATIAGVNTIVVFCHNEEDSRILCDKLEQLLNTAPIKKA